MSKPLIGILSGTGPLAGADVFQKLLHHAAASKNIWLDEDYPDVLLYSHGIAEVDNAATLASHFKDELHAGLHKLELSEVTVVGMACNTAHLYFDELQANCTIPIVHLVKEVVKKASQMPIDYLLLTSAASKKHELYHAELQKKQVSFVETTADHQLQVDEVIKLVMGGKLGDAQKLLTQVITANQYAQCQGVIAACTELPLALADGLHKVVIDSNQVLAEALLRQSEA